MLKRLWILISLLWTVPLAFLNWDHLLRADVFWSLAAPWIIGVVCWLSWRFVAGGRKPKSTAVTRYRY